MFNALSIKVKLLACVVGAILTISIIIEIQSIYSLNNEAKDIILNSEQNAYKVKKDELKNYVSLAYKTVESYYKRTEKEKIQKEVENYLKEQTAFLFTIIESEYEKNKDTMTQEELFNRIKSILYPVKFGKSGYFFAYNTKGVCLILPPKPTLEGKSLIHLKDKNGVEFIKEIIKAGQSSSSDGYITYLWPKPGIEGEHLKVSYVKMFKPLNLIIGTGAYVDDISEQVKKEALEAIGQMKYGKDGYYLVLDSKGTMLMHPMAKHLNGKNVITMKDAKGKALTKEIVKVANSNKQGGIITYWWDKPGTKNDPKEKYSYTKKFEPWDFVIVSGAYIDDIKKNIKDMKGQVNKGITSTIFTSIIIILVVILLISFITIIILNKIIVNPLSRFQEGLLNFFKYINKEQEHIDLLEVKTSDEIGKMSSLINTNITKSKEMIEQDNILINDVKDIVNNVAKGFLDKKINSSTNNHSLEELKSLLNEMLENLERLVGKNINALSDVLEVYSNRDFTKTLDASSSGKIGSEIINLNKMITQILVDSQDDGTTLQEKSIDLTSNVQVLNENATSQAASLEETAASIEEITGNIKQTSQKAQEMLNISSETQSSAIKGKELASKTVNSMDEINETVININEAITVIDQIAFQTNILSLNAAVEAATAGEAGKGFAVVAQEVRNLAARSAEAAKEIKELVESATIKANEGKSISTSMIEGFNELEEKIQHTNNLINDVTNAAREQDAGMSQISDAVNQLDKFTQENASIADKANFIAKETNQIANDIVENVSKNQFNGKK